MAKALPVAFKGAVLCKSSAAFVGGLRSGEKPGGASDLTTLLSDVCDVGSNLFVVLASPVVFVGVRAPAFVDGEPVVLPNIGHVLGRGCSPAEVDVGMGSCRST